jgi:hypothetical protein
MAHPYNTRAQKQLVYSQKKNGEREIAARMHRARSQSLSELFEPRKRLTDTSMAPPKLAEPSQTVRPTRVQTRSRGTREENDQQPPEIVDIDEIPSPEDIPVESTPIQEEIPQPQVETMKEDTPEAAQEPQNEAVGTHQEGQPENAEAAMEINGSTQNPEVEVQPNVPQIPIPDFSFSAEPTGEMGKAWEEWMAKEQPEAAGTSNQPTQQEDRIQIPSSPRKKPAAEIVLPRTPEGIQVDSQLLGHVESSSFPTMT